MRTATQPHSTHRDWTKLYYDGGNEETRGERREKERKGGNAYSIRCLYAQRTQEEENSDNEIHTWRSRFASSKQKQCKQQIFTTTKPTSSNNNNSNNMRPTEQYSMGGRMGATWMVENGIVETTSKNYGQKWLHSMLLVFLLYIFLFLFIFFFACFNKQYFHDVLSLVAYQRQPDMDGLVE